MKRYKRLFISLGTFFALLLVVVVLFAAGILRPAMFGTFGLVKESRREFVVERPMQTVAMRLMMANVQPIMMERLGVKILGEPRKVKENIDIKEYMSGRWSAEIEEEAMVERNDPRMGKMVFTIHTSMKAGPEGIRIVTKLREPTEILKRFEQSVTLTPVEEPVSEEKKVGWSSMFVKTFTSGKTKFEITYSSDITVPYPDFSFIRAEADRQIAAEHERVMDVMEEIFRESAGGTEVLVYPRG